MRTLRLSLAGTVTFGLLAGLVVGSAPLLASQDAIIVAQDGSGAHTTISAAVDAASDGDTILVQPGTYDESVLVSKDITIRGDGDRAAVVVELSEELTPGLGWDDPGLPHAFRFEDCAATLENLTLRGESSRISITGGAPTLRGLSLESVGYDYDPVENKNFHLTIGLEIMDGSVAILRDSTVVDTDLMIDSGASPTIEGNQLIGGLVFVQGDGVSPVIRDNVFEDNHVDGIWISGGATPEVVGNTIVGAVQEGISVKDPAFPDGALDTGTHAFLRDNTFRDCVRGVFLAPKAAATLEDNEFLGNDIAITIDDAEALISGNVIHDNGGGIFVERGAPVLEDNSISGNNSGLGLARPAKPILSGGNVICDNGTNIRLMKGAEMPSVEGNDICADA
ncbi:MAG: pectinesterase family protein [Candidatus Eisenbacteria bacterium]|nr:pectinesterase family protein [Candidatus Eisenbacteria bacterium]